jgi:hypothetical protein
MCIPPVVASHWLSNDIPAVTSQHATIELLHMSLYMWCVASKESRQSVLSRTSSVYVHIYILTNLLRLSDGSLLAKSVPAFADRGCHVVSMTDPYSHILGFLDRSRYCFSSSSSVVLMRLSGLRSRPTTAQKIW